MASNLFSGIIVDCWASSKSVEWLDITFSLAIFLSTFSDVVSSAWATLLGIKERSSILEALLVSAADIAAGESL